MKVDFSWKALISFGWKTKLLNKNYYFGEQCYKFNVCLIMSGFVNRPIYVGECIKMKSKLINLLRSSILWSDMYLEYLGFAWNIKIYKVQEIIFDYCICNT